MNNTQSEGAAPGRPLRMWPGVAAVAVQWLVLLGTPLVAPDAVPFRIICGLACGLAVILWWAFFSRAAQVERWGALGLMAVAYLATRPLLHPSIATGMMGMAFLIYVTPWLSLAFVIWAWASRNWSVMKRRVSMAAAIALACLGWTLVRTGGISGAGGSDLAWRWTATPEERLLASTASGPLAAAPAATAEPAPAVAPAEEKPPAAPPAPAAESREAEWPGFRGAGRDGVVAGAQIGTDWAAAPPVELWRRPVGPGWSSFAVDGELFYTQEQRGEEEIVACYRMSSGEPVWMHKDALRFWESNGGAGPRATPALSGGRVYALGATGVLNALDAASGAVVWKRDAAKDAGAKLPVWGFAGSPLVHGDMVVVAASGVLLAYDRATGAPRWRGPAGGGGYSSPQLAMIGGVEQILLLKGNGAISVSPADGAVLWSHQWPGDGIVQASVTADGGVLLGSGSGMGGDKGVKRLAVSHGAGGWTAEQRWMSNGLKPYFSDFVIHGGHAYGFDGGILACIDLQDGKRKWKGGRYGHGQLVLLREQALLLVLTEEGEVALVRAGSDQFTELARMPAIEGKTWNHPVVAGGRLLVRNGEEMVAFRLPEAPR